MAEYLSANKFPYLDIQDLFLLHKYNPHSHHFESSSFH